MAKKKKTGHGWTSKKSVRRSAKYKKGEAKKKTAAKERKKVITSFGGQPRWPPGMEGRLPPPQQPRMPPTRRRFRDFEDVPVRRDIEFNIGRDAEMEENNEELEREIERGSPVRGGYEGREDNARERRRGKRNEGSESESDEEEEVMEERDIDNEEGWITRVSDTLRAPTVDEDGWTTTRTTPGTGRARARANRARELDAAHKERRGRRERERGPTVMDLMEEDNLMGGGDGMSSDEPTSSDEEGTYRVSGGGGYRPKDLRDMVYEKLTEGEMAPDEAEGMIVRGEESSWIYEYQGASVGVGWKRFLGRGSGGRRSEGWRARENRIDAMRSARKDIITQADMKAVATERLRGRGAGTVAGEQEVIYAEYLAKVMRGLKRGFKVSCDRMGMKGLTLLEICYMLEVVGKLNLDGYYISGKMTRYVMHTKNDEGSQPVANNKQFRDVTAVELPLSRVASLAKDGGYGMWGAPYGTDSPTNILEGLVLDYGEEEGSDLNCFFVMEGCYISRRVWRDVGEGGDSFPNGLKTGGFSELMWKNWSMMTEIQGKAYKVVIPGGRKNCVDECIVENYREMVSEERAQGVVRERNGVMRGEYADKRMRSSKAKKRKKKESYEKEYDLMVRHGYSNEMVRRVRLEWMKGSLNLRVVYGVERRDRGGIQWRGREVGETDREIKKALEKVGGEENLLDVGIMRIGMDGKVYQKRLEMKEDELVMDHDRFGLQATDGEGKEATMGTILHAITMTPCFDAGSFLKNKKYREEVTERVEEVTTKYMETVRMRQRGVYEEGVDMVEEAREMVEYQKERHREGETRNLFFKKTKAGGEEERSEQKEWQKKQRPPLVIAYDMETVELRKGAFERDVVDKSLFRGVEEVDLEIYEPEHTQIPYSIQWVPVNVSDEGEVKEEKLRNQMEPTRYEWLGRRDSELKNQWFEVGTGEKRKRVKGEWVVLDEPKVEYGGEKLGRCVNEFIKKVGEYALEHEFSTVSCYAHNGCGFDAFVLEAFNTKYGVWSRLKTGRGLLKVTLDYPYVDADSGKEKILKIHFLDTKVFLSFALSKICKDFDVPKEWTKLDFPITRMRWYNCYHPKIKEITEPYAKNDVLSLSFVIKQINRMISFQSKSVEEEGMEEFVIRREEEEEVMMMEVEGGREGEAMRKMKEVKPYSPTSGNPPITQFLTFMSVVKKMLDTFFTKNDLQKPMSVDVAPFRHWIERSQMGGRTSPYAKAYCSGHWEKILEAFLAGDKEEMGRLAREAMEEGDCGRVLDVTSLYPYAMGCCPMPTGEPRAMTIEECEKSVRDVGCEECERRMSLCEIHTVSGGTKKGDPSLREFGVIMVKGLKVGEGAKGMLRHQCGRKTEKGKEGLIYSLENSEEIVKRFGGKSKMAEIEAFTNIDLYWMGRQGFEWEVVGGYSWGVSGGYSDLVFGGFQLRREAKKAGNQCLQQTLKLFLNGMFGIHSQKVIRTKDLLCTLPEGLENTRFDDPRVAAFVAKNHFKTFDARFSLSDKTDLNNGQSVITGKVRKDTGEALGGGYSPNHVGGAVLAWSRHVMNLAMFAISERHTMYTDTDSISVPEVVYQKMIKLGGGLIDETGKKLGSYKNDHADYFKDPIRNTPAVMFSAIGAKKVKMHIVVDKTGELRICNTYKGFLSQGCCPQSGRKFSMEKMQYEQSKALIEILFRGAPEDRVGTRWNRKSGEGVTIEKSVLLSCESKTYLNHCKGFTVGEDAKIATFHPDKFGFCSYVVPHGSTYEGEVIRPVFDEVKGVWELPKEEWEESLKKGMGEGVTMERMSLLLEKYYKERSSYHRGGESEEELSRSAMIHDLFDSLEEEES